MSWKTLHSLSTFLLFVKDILGNEAATEQRIQANLSNLKKGKSPSPSRARAQVLHLTIRPYYATMQYNVLRSYCIFTKNYKDVLRVFTPYIVNTGSCLGQWF